MAALAVALGMAYYKLLVLPTSFDGDFKRNLAGARIVNFVAIAWLASDLTRRGVVRRIAQLAPWVGAVGRDGLVCFVAGAVISLIVDSVLFTLTGGLLDVPYGFAADAIAIGLLFAIPHRQRLFDALGFGSITSAAKAKG
ncbi:OpgC protein [Caballeronia sordidicola]|uniref:OpgC protein n=1 Tax=Caballeronia sordidicola TaxID=196367 RepID=A0A242MCJ3_CABSO|nr:OpgC protein [Caballeronia sordidicola]